MFEILTNEQVEKMSDRELELSQDYYRHNLNQVNLELYQRSAKTTNEPIAETLPTEPSIKLKIRGLKKKDIK
jgi:hypothetical protein